jgi:hypothetical protein
MNKIVLTGVVMTFITLAAFIILAFTIGYDAGRHSRHREVVDYITRQSVLTRRLIRLGDEQTMREVEKESLTLEKDNGSDGNS